MAIHFYVHSISISMPFWWHECHIALHPNENDKTKQRLAIDTKESANRNDVWNCQSEFFSNFILSYILTFMVVDLAP